MRAQLAGIAITLVAAVAGCDHRPRPPKVEPPPVAANDEAAAAASDAAPEPAPAADAAPAAPAPDAGGAAPTAPAPVDDAAAAAALRAKNPDQFDKCSASAQHALAIMVAETPEASRGDLLKQQPALMEAMRGQCINASWPAPLLTCIGNAKDMQALSACQSLVPKGAPP